MASEIGRCFLRINPKQGGRWLISVRNTGEGVESMGRGRAKAKQTKVARRLKYSGPDTDLDRLQAELSGDSEKPEPSSEEDTETEDDPYAKYAEDDYEDPRS